MKKYSNFKSQDRFNTLTLSPKHTSHHYYPLVKRHDYNQFGSPTIKKNSVKNIFHDMVPRVNDKSVKHITPIHEKETFFQNQYQQHDGHSLRKYYQTQETIKPKKNL